jgi:L-ascorbate metabolism protein UlaG (beta-lactamase superfamily)
MELTWHGHSTWHVSVGDPSLLIDPFFDNPKTDLEPGDIESPDYVLLTHGHADHVADVGAFAHDSVVVGTPELVGWVESEYGGETVEETGEEDDEADAEPSADTGVDAAEPADEAETVDPEDIEEVAEPGDDPDVEPDGGSSVETIGMNLGGTIEAGDAYVTMHRADHTNGIMTGYEMDAGMPAGFVISTDVPTQSTDEESTTFYHAGDTALFTEMREVIGPYLEPDAAAVPIGDHFTMGPWQAAIAVDWLDVDYAFPMHYDTFPPIEQDPEDFAREVEATGSDAEVHVLDGDETFDLGDAPDR